MNLLVSGHVFQPLPKILLLFLGKPMVAELL